eukprot:gene2750-8128_t
METAGNVAISDAFGMDFRCTHSIIVTRLGIFDGVNFQKNTQRKPITVKLWETTRDNLILEKVVHPMDGEHVGAFRYVSINELLLPKNVVFTLTAEGYDSMHPCLKLRSDAIHANDNGGVIEWLPVTRRGHPGLKLPPIMNDLLHEENSIYIGPSMAFRTERIPPGVIYSMPWQPDASYTPVYISTSDTLHLDFLIDSTLVEVATREEFESCISSNIIFDWTSKVSRSTTKKAVGLTNLHIGVHFFMSKQHCHLGMKLEVHVSPPQDIREKNNAYWLLMIVECVLILKTLEQLRETQHERKIAYRIKLEQEEKLLLKESEDFGDIVIIPNFQDTYRQLPRKLIAMYTYAAVLGAKFVLKTDDDAFLNIPKLWWGSFRENWPVERSGKWRELEFSENTYPIFACGSGHILSGDVVQWIAASSTGLFAFQGEDVSLGIWMQAFHPRIVRDDRWKCFGMSVSCSEDMLSSPEHTPETLVFLFNQWQQCQRLCLSCEE